MEAHELQDILDRRDARRSRSAWLILVAVAVAVGAAWLLYAANKSVAQDRESRDSIRRAIDSIGQ